MKSPWTFVAIAFALWCIAVMLILVLAGMSAGEAMQILREYLRR